jgi:hypothetical protein
VKQVALALAIIAGAVLVPGSPAAAYTCGSAAPRDQESGWTQAISDPATPIRTGPYSSCPPGGLQQNWYAYTSFTTDFHCYTINSYGNVWSYTNFPNNGMYGWVYSGNTNPDALTRCP